ncbi:PucR family transcriptional regulator [Brevibacillus centrosporus]|uniref:PucR family transcriptional regulator n=1 Tax=Brevibacillus centrosporus TaxID=54910 RepID=UPI003B027994
MPITMRQLMRVGGLRDCRVVAGHRGLDRLVKYVTIMEVPDIAKWLKGDELILSSLYAIKDDAEAQKELIRQLHEQGTVALAIKPHRFVDEIPQSLLEEANTYDFPVIEIPEKISYLEILPPVSHAIFDRKVVLQEDLEQASKVLNEISLNEQGMESLIETLGMLTKNTITVESMLSYMQVPPLPFACEPLSSEQIRELAFIKRPVHLTRTCERGEMECIVAPILLDGHVYGNITCWAFERDHLEMDLAILEKASTLLALEFLRLKVRFDTEQQYKNEFLRDVFVNEHLILEDVRERGLPYGFTLDEPYICMVIRAEGEEKRENPFDLADRTERLLRVWTQRVITGFFRQMVVCLCPVESGISSEELKKRAEKLAEQLKKQTASKGSFRVGIGRDHGAGISGLRESFREAQQSILLGSAMNNRGTVIHYNDLGIYRLLAQFQDRAEMHSFFEETAGKLFEHDRNSDLQLVKTLRLYFLHDEKLTETAAALFLHVNTLKYRLRRIEKLTGYSLQQSEGKLMLHIGLKLADLMGDDYRYR